MEWYEAGNTPMPIKPRSGEAFAGKGLVLVKRDRSVCSSAAKRSGS
jgi:hypothetical protein